jgi:hypothetical protein
MIMQSKVKAFQAAFFLVQGDGITVGDIRRIAIQYMVDDSLLLEAVTSGDSRIAAAILGVSEDEINDVIEGKRDIN